MLRRLFDNQWTYFILAGALFVVLLFTQFEIQLPPRPKGTVADIQKLAERGDTNVIFILIDTLRADHLQSYGYERATSPTLDYLARTGVRFDKVISQSSWTKASMASIWTSTWPQRTGVLRWNHALPEQIEMPAEVLQKAGFHTAGIWRNGWVSPNFGFSQGFQTYLKPVARQVPAQFKRTTPSASSIAGTDEDLTFAAQEFLRSYGHKRFFLYVHLMDVHQFAYDEASARFGTDFVDTYDNSINWVDRNVGAILEELAKQDLWRRTIVVVASDHGEGFREHEFEGHARTVYQEVTYVPWLIALPFELEPGLVVEQTVGNVDIWPTTFALLGLPEQQGVDGRSMLPAILAAGGEGTAPPDQAYYSQIDRSWGRPTVDPDPLVGVTLGELRYIKPLRDAPPPGFDRETSRDRHRSELYDRRSDPGETRDLLAAGDHDLPPELQQALAEYLSESSPPWGEQPPEVKLDEMELNQLRALGYVIK